MNGISRRIAAAWRQTTASGALPTAVFVLMVLGAVFVAVAAPRQDLHMQTRALQQVFRAAPAVEDSVVASADWHQLVGDQAGQAATLRAADLDAQAGVLADGMSGVSVPLAPPSADWSGVTSEFVPVTGGATAQFEFVYRSALSRHARLVSGRLPDHSSMTLNPGVPPGTPGESAVRGGTLEVAVTSATAARFGLSAGSRLVAQNNVVLLVTAVISPVASASAFWTLDPVVATPALGSAGSWMGAVLVGPDEASDMQYAFGSAGMKVFWDFPLALAGVSGTAAGQLAAHLNAASNSDIAGGSIVGSDTLEPGAITVSSGLVTRLVAFGQAQAAVNAVLSLLLVGLAVIGAVAVLLGVHLLTQLRTGEFAVLRARGGAPWQLALLTLRGSVTAVPAGAAGAALAIAVTPGQNAPLAWWLAGLIVLVALSGPALLVMRRHGAAVRPAGRAAVRPADKAALRRVVTEVTLVAAALGGLVILRQQGLPPSGGLDAYTGAAPVLVAVPAALLVLRLYPLAPRALLRVSAARRGVAGFVAMARAARASPSAALPAFGLVLALGVAAFGGMARDAVLRGQEAASWQSTGADAVIDDSASPAGVGPAALQAIAAVRGVRQVAAVTVIAGTLPSGTAVEVIAVNPVSYAALVATTPWPRLPAGALAPAAGGPVTAVASPAVAASFHSGPVKLATGAVRTVSARVAAATAGTPALPGQDTFLILPSWALRASPSLVLLTGEGLDQQALRAAVRQRMPHATVSLRSAALAALTGSPLQQGAVSAFALGVAAAAGFSAVIVLLSLAVEARDRAAALARLAAMGLAEGQARRMVALEALPVLLAAVLAGAACGWVLAPLTGPSLNLSVFTGGAVAVPISADVMSLAAPAAGLLVLALAVLFAQTLRIRRSRALWR